MKKFKELRESYLEEKLKASDPAGTYIHDFVHSDNPKFAGKSKAKRIQMALAASYAAKGKSRNEEVEEIDEAANAAQQAAIAIAMKKAGKKPKNEEVEEVDEGMMATAKKVVKTVGKAFTGGSDVDQLKNLQKKMSMPQTGKKPQMKEDSEILDEEKPGLYANIHAKQRRIAAGSGEHMRKPGSKGAPTASAFKDAAKTAKK